MYNHFPILVVFHITTYQWFGNYIKNTRRVNFFLFLTPKETIKFFENPHIREKQKISKKVTFWKVIFFEVATSKISLFKKWICLRWRPRNVTFWKVSKSFKTHPNLILSSGKNSYQVFEPEFWKWENSIKEISFMVIFRLKVGFCHVFEK